MIDLILCVFAAFILAIPITMGLGIVYFCVAATIVDFFRLNYGDKPVGFRFLNAALGLTVVSYILVVAFLLRNM